jgi:hypothetical protein
MLAIEDHGCAKFFLVGVNDLLVRVLTQQGSKQARSRGRVQSPEGGEWFGGETWKCFWLFDTSWPVPRRRWLDDALSEFEDLSA